MRRNRYGSGAVRHYRAHLLVILVTAAALLSGLHENVQDTLTDLRFRSSPRPASQDTVLIAIDPRSLDELGVWPWPRSFHAQLIRRLADAKVSEIAFDVDFSSRSDAASDQAFLDALKSADGSVVLPVFQQAGGAGDVHVTKPLRQFSTNAWTAAVNVMADRGGLVRRYWPVAQIGSEWVPSLASVLARRHALQREPFLIDFGIRPETIPVVSYIDILRGAPEALQRVAGKSIIVGSTAVELGDRFNVPVYGVVAGPMLQALAAESLLQHRDLRPSARPTVLVGLAALMIVMAGLWRRTPGTVRAILLVGTAMALEAGSAVVQEKLPLVIETSLLHIALAAYLAAVLFEEINIRGLLRRVAESRFARVAALVGDGLVCADASGRIRVWNPSAATIFGFEAEDMIGRPLDDLWHRRPHDDFSTSGLSPAMLQRRGVRRSRSKA